MARKKTAFRKAQPTTSLVDHLIEASRRGPRGIELPPAAKADIDAVLSDDRIKSGEEFVSATQIAKYLKEKHKISAAIHTLTRKVKEYAGGAL